MMIYKDDFILIGDRAYNIKVSPENEVSRKLFFYKKNNVKVKFNLAFKPEYEVSGEIIECKKKVNDKDDDGKPIEYVTDYCIIRNNGSDIMILLNEIDPETIFPENFNPVKFYERIAINEQQRVRIYERDNNHCRYNLDGCLFNKELQIDHIIPVSLGGLNIDENLVTCCSNCNLKKSDKIIYPK